MLTKTMATFMVGLMLGTGALTVADSEARSEARARLEARAEARSAAGLPGLGLLTKSRTEAATEAGGATDEGSAGTPSESGQAQADGGSSHSFRHLFLAARAQGHDLLAAFRVAAEAWLAIQFNS